MRNFSSLFQIIVLFPKNKHCFNEEKLPQSVYKQFKTESTCTVDTCDWAFSDIYPELPKKQMRAHKCLQWTL